MKLARTTAHRYSITGTQTPVTLVLHQQVAPSQPTAGPQQQPSPHVHRTSQTATALPAAATAASTAATIAGVSAKTIFSAVTGLMVPLYAVMMFAPKSKLARKFIIDSPVLYFLGAVLYCTVLAHCWQQGLCDVLVAAWQNATSSSFLPDASAFSVLFADKAFTLLAWIHLLLLDFFQARAVLIDGIQQGVFTAHSILLCFMFGPTGLASHWLTRQLTAKRA